jgi:hypothetical protein
MERENSREQVHFKTAPFPTTTNFLIPCALITLGVWLSANLPKIDAITLPGGFDLPSAIAFP